MGHPERKAEVVTLDPALTQELMSLIPAGTLPESNDLSLAIQFLITENRQLQRQLLMRTQQVRELATERLIWGAGGSTETIQELCEKYDLKLESGLFYLLLIRLPGNEEHEDAMAVARNRLTIRSILEESFSMGFGVNCSVVRGDEFALIAAADIGNDTAAKGLRFNKAVENFKAKVDSACGRPTVICIGPEAHDAASIQESFQILLDLREHSIALHSHDVILTMEDFPTHKPLQPDEHPFTAMAVEKQYVNAILAKDFAQAKQLTIDKMKTLLDGSINGQKMLKPFLESRMEATSDILMTSLSAISANGGTAYDDLEAIKVRDNDDISYLFRVVECAFDRMDEFFNNSDSDIGGTAGKVIKFVNSNYHNPALSVEIICDEMGKSRSYLSRMFKENTGMNLLDFLHTTRITEAKRLLTDSTLSVSEIGEKVGYYSGWTLARVFKRYEGITPSAYREAYGRGELKGSEG